MMRVLGMKCETCSRRTPVMKFDEFQLAGRLSGDAMARIRHFLARHGGGAPERQQERIDRKAKERSRRERLRLAGHVRQSSTKVLAPPEVLKQIGSPAAAGRCLVTPCAFWTPERTPFSSICFRDVGDRICGRPWPCETHPDEQTTGDEQPAEVANTSPHRPEVCTFETIPFVRICGAPAEAGSRCERHREAPELSTTELAAVAGVELDPIHSVPSPERGTS